MSQQVAIKALHVQHSTLFSSLHNIALYYMCRVDKDSPSEESGLKVGDQIMDINGHSFASIFHQEAVYILRSYPTLIMTIKVKSNYRKFNVLISLDHSHTLSIQSLGKLPKLASDAQEGTIHTYTCRISH